MTAGRRVLTIARTVAGVVVLAALGLAGEVAWVLSRDYLPADSAPAASAEVGAANRPGRPLRLVVLGDSTAAGIGASATSTTVGGRAASVLSEASRRPVHLRSVAKSGARAADLGDQVRRALDLRPDVALVLVGANDATHASALDSVAADLRAAVDRLVDAGAVVVVGTCPDLGAARAFPQPLREIAAWRGRAVAAAELRAVREAGGLGVDLGALTGPAFRADERTLSTDKFHPSDRGYALWADALAPALRKAAQQAG